MLLGASALIGLLVVPIAASWSMPVRVTFQVQLDVTLTASQRVIRRLADDLESAFRSYAPRSDGPFVLFESPNLPACSV
jgi:hypothetical protein